MNPKPMMNAYYNGNRGKVRVICPWCEANGIRRMTGRRFPSLANILYRDVICRACGHNMCLDNKELEAGFDLVEHWRYNGKNNSERGKKITTFPSIADLKRARADDRGAYLTNDKGITFAQFRVLMMGRNQERVMIFTT